MSPIRLRSLGPVLGDCAKPMKNFQPHRKQSEDQNKTLSVIKPQTSRVVELPQLDVITLHLQNQMDVSALDDFPILSNPKRKSESVQVHGLIQEKPQTSKAVD